MPIALNITPPNLSQPRPSIIPNIRRGIIRGSPPAANVENEPKNVPGIYENILILLCIHIRCTVTRATNMPAPGKVRTLPKYIVIMAYATPLIRQKKQLLTPFQPLSGHAKYDVQPEKPAQLKAPRPISGVMLDQMAHKIVVESPKHVI